MDPTPCRCGHGREWHDSCSKCFCPFFLPTSVKDRAIVKAWREDRAKREQLEGGGS